MKFTDCHPITNLVFYIGAIGFGMCLLHPACLVCSFLFALVYYSIVKGEVRKYLGRILMLFMVVSLINPFFNRYGETILFVYFNGRSYTLEALGYGLALAGMFCSIMTWFASYSVVMTKDKFLFCFGKLAPTVSLILTMVFRFIPDFQRKLQQVSGIRKSIGLSTSSGTNREKIKHGMNIISSVTSWALENSVVTADSMRSRGYGSGRRTSYSIYSFKKKDQFLLFIMLLLLLITLLCALNGGFTAEYTPSLYISDWDNAWTIIGVGSYFLFLAIPSVLHLIEEIIWHISRSKI